MSLSLLNQTVALCKENFVLDKQFIFTGKYGCYPEIQDESWASRYIGVTVILPLFVDGVSTVAILHHHRKDREVQSPLSKLFIQQAILYFSVVFTLSLIAGGFQFSASIQLDGRALIALVTLPNIMACRLILQLREETALPTPTEAGLQLSIAVQRGLHPDESSDPLSS